MAPPECLGLVLVLTFEPGDEIRERAHLWQLRGPSLCEGLVGRKHFLEHIRGRPAVLQQVMLTPQHHVPVGCQPEEDDPHERRTIEHESLASICLEPGVDRGALIWVVCHIAQVELDVETPAHNLHGSALVLPGEQRPQRRVAGNHQRPGPLKGRNIERPVDLESLNYCIEVVRLRGQGMEKHPLLERRQRVDILDDVFSTHDGAETGLEGIERRPAHRDSGLVHHR